MPSRAFFVFLQELHKLGVILYRKGRNALAGILCFSSRAEDTTPEPIQQGDVAMPSRAFFVFLPAA